VSDRQLPLSLPRTLLFAVVAIVGAGGGATPARAQVADTIATSLVFSPSRYAQSALDAPTAVTVLTAEEIWRFGYRSLEEVLGAVRGMFGLDDRDYTYLNIRGVLRSGDYSTRLLLLVDGRRINSMIQDYSAIGVEALVNLEAIDRVEVTHGPGSSLYGTNAMYAIVNIITRRASRDSATVVRVDLQSHETVRLSLREGHRTRGGIDLFGQVGGSRSRGATVRLPAFATSDNPTGRIAGLDGDASGNALGSVRAGDFHLLAAVSRRDNRVPTAPYGTVPGDKRTGTSQRLGLLSAQYEHVYDNLSRLWATVSAFVSDQHESYSYTDFLNRERYRSGSGMLEAQYLRFFGAGHTLIVGGEGRATSEASIRIVDDATRIPSVQIDAPSHVLAAFAQSELRVSDQLTAHVGVRHDRYSRELSAWSPRIGATWRPRATTAVKGSYGRAFRAPNGYELFYNDAGLTQVRPPNGLRPERLRSTELSIEHGFRPWMHGALTLYDSYTRDLIGLVPLDSSAILAYANLDRQRFRGAEFTVRASPGRGSRLDGALALQRTYEQSTGERMSGSPAVVGRLGVSAPLMSPLLLGVAEVRGMSARRTLARATVDGFATLNLGLQLGRTTGGAVVHAMVWNVFNRAISDPGGEEHVHDTLPRDGRTVRLSLRWGF
jgi:outer membrane receptor for ferrienterochelin and colicins